MNPRNNDAATDATAPWYRHRWPWLLIAGPALTIVGCAVTIVLALAHDDVVVPRPADRPVATQAGASAGVQR